MVAKSKVFCSAFFKTNIQSSRDEISLFLRRNLDFKHSIDVEMSLEEERTRDLRIELSKQFDCLKHPRTHFQPIRERTNKVEIRHGHSIVSPSSINGCD